MTWPFENDTSGIVKRISNRSISANRKRNIFIVLTIVLASALLSAIVLYGFGVMQETQNRNQKTAQIMYHAISEQQGQELYKQEEIAWVGEFFNAFSEQVNHSTVNFTYANADMLTSQSMPYSGDLPASENEIVVQESFLDSLGYSNELGQTIQIPFSDGTTHDFKLTGILDVKTGDIGRYTAIISKELVRQQYGDGGMIDYYIGLKGAQNMSEEEATNYANTLAQQLKISDDNVIVRSTYFNLKDENHGSDMLFYFLIGFVTFIGSGIVIYSIFYISVASSIRNYGQLRTIGTTKRQIKKMVYREGKLLAAIAIPIGLVIGNVIGYFLIPAGWYWLTTLCVTVGVGLFAFIIVMIAIHTPVKRAAAVSPLEALRYSDYQGKMKESSVLHRKITPASLAKMNLSRQKAKSTLTIVKRIFELSKQGNSVHQIARTLCEDGVLIPRAYRAMKNGTLETSTGFKFPTDWVAKNVKMILENQVYLGHMVSHKTQTKSFKNKKPVAVPKEEWIIVRNTHEAIIDEETFELVQKFISVKKQPNKTGRPNIFVGLVKCPDCGRNMAFSNPNGREPRFRCRTYVRNSNLCTTHAISYEALQQIVMSDIQKHIKNMEALGDQFIQEMHELSEKGGSKKIKQFEKDLEVAEKRIAEIDSVIMKLFEQNALGKISDERFEKMSSAYESEQKELAQKRDELRTKIRAEEKKTQSTNQFLETIRKYETVTELNRSMLVELIDSIYVYQAEGTGKDRKQRVEINYRFLAGSQCGIA